MSVKELTRPPKPEQVNFEKKIEQFISKGGGVVSDSFEQEDNHRLTLRIPKQLLAKIDLKRRERVGTISRNLWILEVIEKAANKI